MTVGVETTVIEGDVRVVTDAKPAAVAAFRQPFPSLPLTV